MNNIRSYREWSPQFDDSVYIDPSAVVIGRTSIGQDSSIWPLVAVRGDVNFIKIGDRTNIQDNSVLHVARPTTCNNEGFALIIGDDVTVGHGAILHACTIGNRCLIGMGATVLDGAVLECDLLLAAGSLVSLGADPDRSGTRVLADAGEESCMVLAFVPRSAGLKVTRRTGGFCLQTKTGNFEFDIEPEGKGILTRR